MIRFAVQGTVRFSSHTNISVIASLQDFVPTPLKAS